MTKEFPDNYPYSEVQLKWIEELESGKWEQVIGSMEYKNSYCCLGVARHKVLKTEEPHNSSILDPEEFEKLQLINGSGNNSKFPNRKLTSLNDEFEYNFKMIAEILKTEPENYFTNHEEE